MNAFVLLINLAGSTIVDVTLHWLQSIYSTKGEVKKIELA